MTQWLRLQLGNGTLAGQPIVAAAPLAETHIPQIGSGYDHTNGNATFAGLGGNVSYGERVRLSHSGAFGGMVVLTNAAPVGIAEGLAQTFLDTALAGKPSRDWLALYKWAFQDPALVGMQPLADYSQPPVPRTAALNLAAYTGTYGNNPLRLQLTHYDRDTFTFATVGENAAGRSGVTFRIGAQGRAEAVVIESLDRYGQGKFQRLA